MSKYRGYYFGWVQSLRGPMPQIWDADMPTPAGTISKVQIDDAPHDLDVLARAHPMPTESKE